MRYKVRMSLCNWWVFILDQNCKNVGNIGPFDTIEQAENAARATGYIDYDKEVL